MKKIISLILAATMTISAAVTAGAVEYGAEYANQPSKSYSQKFKDVPSSHWAFSYIGEMNERGVLSGYPNGSFYPDNNVSRAEFAKIMTITAGLALEGTYQTFADVPTSHWANIYINTAKNFLSGYNLGGNIVYHPETPAMREDIAVALVKLKGYDTTGYDESMLRVMFHDFDSISSGARPYVATAVERGLVSGYDDDTFRGQNSITRAEAAAMLWRAYQYGNDNKDFNISTTVTPAPTAASTPAPVPTAVPTAAPVVTPEPTQAPVTVTTPAPTLEPTPEPTPEPVQEVNYKYEIKTVAKTDARYVTAGDGYAYWYDDDDNNVYKMNISTNDVSVLCDMNEFTYTDEEANVYSGAEVHKLLYGNNRLYASLYLGKCTSENDYKPHQVSYRIGYDLINNELLTERDSEPDFVYNGSFLTGMGYDVIAQEDVFSGIGVDNYRQINYYYNGCLYSNDRSSNVYSRGFFKYDFNSGWERLVEVDSYHTLSMTYNGGYAYYMDSDSNIISVNLDSGKQEIAVSKDEVKITDMKPFPTNNMTALGNNKFLFNEGNSLRILQPIN